MTPLRQTATSSDDSYGDFSQLDACCETTRERGVGMGVGVGLDYESEGKKDKGFLSSRDPMDGSFDAETEAGTSQSNFQSNNLYSQSNSNFPFKFLVKNPNNTYNTLHHNTRNAHL